MIRIAEKLGFMKVRVVKVCAKYTTIGENYHVNHTLYSDSL